jgi:hypothetical protein
VHTGNNPLNFVDPGGLYQSNWSLRALVPGQVAWDNAFTAYEQGNYVSAGLDAGAMVGAQVLTALTSGEGEAAQQYMNSNWLDTIQLESGLLR